MAKMPPLEICRPQIRASCLVLAAGHGHQEPR